MGREIRRVPPNHVHPMKEVYNFHSCKVEKVYQPMHDKTATEAWEQYLKDWQEWINGKHDEIITKDGENDYPKNDPYRAFCNWHGGAPDFNYYRPAAAEEPTWLQMYETVSEGTPVSPAFATPEELIEYLVDGGDDWDRKSRLEGYTDCGPWSRESAEAFVERGSAPSLVITSDGKMLEPRDTPKP